LELKCKPSLIIDVVHQKDCSKTTVVQGKEC
jgi:hypothetical protein